MTSVEKITKESIEDFVVRMEAMTDEEVFGTMSLLEAASEQAEDVDCDDIVARIAVAETEIKPRYPGQVLAPYRDWK